MYMYTNTYTLTIKHREWEDIEKRSEAVECAGERASPYTPEGHHQPNRVHWATDGNAAATEAQFAGNGQVATDSTHRNAQSQCAKRSPTFH